ncbi:hypothetical protein NQ176_g3066 [Zarea fungicola]|uniref:Uncharacterized protein n=1 Tax=Zarea fungicola TaxID=93591 RepID=A0ACC1NMC5_9HYPO|nr:hypothetical protein NQ176_g3066 [Lecanicillium fungicola]
MQLPESQKLCLKSSADFPGNWHAHSAASELAACPNCFQRHIRGTRLELEFVKESSVQATHSCRFDTPTVSRYLLEMAQSGSSTESLVAFAKTRHTVSECKGSHGSRPSDGTRWYSAKNRNIPGFVACEACFMDCIQGGPLATQFELSPDKQLEPDVWVCDLSVPFIRRHLADATSPSDWPSFCSKASTRMQLQSCPGSQAVFPSSYQWFSPVSGPKELLICSACFHDHIEGFDDPGNWRDAGNNVLSIYGSAVFCCLGQHNLLLATAIAQNASNPNLFWTAARRWIEKPLCEPATAPDETWYTLPSNPANFAVCPACYVCVVEPLGLTDTFVPRTRSSSIQPATCSLNRAAPRFQQFLTKLFQACYGIDAKVFDKYVVQFAPLPVCMRDQDLEGGTWFGWDECNICPDCFHSFAHGTVLAELMPLNGKSIPERRMCEMYSPRMRSLFLAACSTVPLDTRCLLEAAKERRRIYWQTVPLMRDILSRAQSQLNRQRIANTTSSAYMLMGGLQETSMLGQGPTYSLPNAGQVFHNQLEVQGAVLGIEGEKIATALRNGNGRAVISYLEPIWRGVE